MTHRRTFTLASSVLAAGMALAQPQTPPAPPAPAARPAPAPLVAPAPMPTMEPMPAMPPMAPRAMDFDYQPRDLEINLNIDMQERMEMLREKAEEMSAAALARDDVRAQVDAQMAYARSMVSNRLAFAPQVAPVPPVPPAGPVKGRMMGGSEDSLYQRGQSALDGKRWDDAVEYFTQAAAKNGPRVDGALFWKAYALKKVGKNSEALAALAELRKAAPQSRWLDDAKALELDLGKPVSPEAESDEELKLLALNGIMQSDPERAIPLVENQLKSSASPRVKRNALFVLAQSSNPKAQAAIEKIARGGSNPDLQVKAISYLTERRNANAGQMLSEIYASTNDVQVKRAVLQAYMSNRDKDRIIAAAKNEKSPELRSMAIGYLGSTPGNPELWQLYQSESSVEVKQQILQNMWNNGDSAKLLEVVRTEKEPRLRRLAIQVLGSQKNGQNTDALVQIYNSEQDQATKNAILDSFTGQRNATALISLAKAEKDPRMKLRIVERISSMASKSKEAQQYLEELLK